MRLSNTQIRRVAIAVGTGAAIALGLAVSHALNAQNGCVQTIFTSGKATNGQEIVYSWGCLAPQRFRQWSVMASTPSQQWEARTPDWQVE